MGIREIEVFRAVMTAGTTSKAATMLGISQPAVSQAIRKLEEGADLQLFVRARGRLVPTQEAMALMVDVDQLFVGFEAIEHRLKSLRNLGIGRLTVAVHPALGNSFLPRALADFDLVKRDIQVSLRVLSSKEVHQQVSSGQCDFGLMADEMPVAGLEHSDFLDSIGVIVMHASHPLAKRRMIYPQDLAGVDFLALNPEDSSRHRLESTLRDEGVELKIRVETAYSHTLCELALLGVGVGFVNPVAVFDFINRGLVVKPFSVDVRFASLLVFRPGKPLPENARQFIRSLRIRLNKDLQQLERSLHQA
ncbi:LysR family transcriptional regulator [Pseudomonas gingeri]|uniref:LysR substrate-binding domain-containing protein n=1 Tax=Pseudomonas gingeri TaxID=117681 RepID=UPI0015A2D821|nr:LysR substrate-binding domain-containing protein [Pseudomonas gingeri]NWA27966.1 LysR family transcriptional regulator [Pseudomonas gingeri]NWD70039.1 LysR family transcriptional regulator [Pseudomonas gingeri]NWD78393.1 LysR family transcriptional regulator [Pseudomonas gingeri]